MNEIINDLRERLAKAESERDAFIDVIGIGLIPLSSLLTQEEIDFVMTVKQMPGSKLDYCASEWVDDGSKHGRMNFFWERPEELGIIEAVGSYKWKPSKNLKVIAFYEKGEGDE